MARLPRCGSFAISFAKLFTGRCLLKPPKRTNSTGTTWSASDPKRTSGRPFLPSCAIQGSELFIRELDIDRGNVFLQMRDLRSARNGKHYRAALEDPGESNLARSRVMGLGD